MFFAPSAPIFFTFFLLLMFVVSLILKAPGSESNEEQVQFQFYFQL